MENLILGINGRPEEKWQYRISPEDRLGSVGKKRQRANKNRND